MSQELDDFLRRREQAASAPARASVKAAAAQGIQPDAAAQHAATARRYGVSPAVVAASPELFKQEDAADEADRIITSAPKLGDWLASREHNAAMARDDLAPMSDAEKTITTRAPRESITSRLINAAKLPAQAIAGAVDYWTLGAGAAPVLPTLRAAGADLTVANVGRALGSGVLGIGTGATGVAAAASALSPFELAFRAVNQADATPTQMILESAGKYLSGAQQAVRPQAKTAEGRGILSGIESTPAAVAAVVGGAYMKSATAGAMLMGGVTGGQSFLTGRQAGLSTEAALAYGGIDAAVEFGTERLPLGELVGPHSVGSPFIKRFVKSTAEEIVGEQVATVLQDFNAWAFIESNQGKTFSQFLAERPGAAYETALATLFTAGSMNIAAEGLHRAGAIAGKQFARAAPAERDAEVLDVLGQIAAASKVAQRDPGSFEDFVRQAADGTTAEDVFIDANQLSIVLEQSGLSPTQAAELTGIAVEDMQLAVQTGVDLRIPIETYAARVANSDIGPALLDHLRIDPESMSRAEAKVFMQSAETELQSLVDAQTTLVLKSDAERASRDAVKEQILGELNTAGRFSPSVNEAYATLHATAMANIAARQGMTAEELAQRYGLQVQSGEVSQPTFDQDGKPAKPQWMADILESAQVRKDTAVRLSTEGKPIRFTGENGRSAIAGPDMSKPGGYRLTYFDEAGPSGHVEFSTLTEAADEALKSRFVPEQGPSIEEQHAADPNSAVNRYNQGKKDRPTLKPAVRVGRKVYSSVADHLSAISQIPDLKQRQSARLDGENRGYVTETGKYLDRFRAQEYAKSFGLISKDAPSWAQTSPDLISENLMRFDLQEELYGPSIEEQHAADPNSAINRYNQDAVFYSALSRAVEAQKTNKAPGAQWIATLKKAPGVKQEELEWSGLLDFLQMQEGQPVTKQQITELLEGGGIRTDEVVLGGENDDAIQDRAQELYDAAESEAINDVEVYTSHFYEEVQVEVGEDEDGDPIEETKYQVYGPYADEDSVYDTAEEAETASDDMNNEERSNVLQDFEFQGRWSDFEEQAREELGRDPQFKDWSSDPSNDSYRELLITLPLGEGKNPARAPSTHWDTEAVVAHARFMEKTDADGAKVLFVEEVQSDWHQKGRDQGYAVGVSAAEKARIDAEHLAAQEARAAAQQKLFAVVDAETDTLLARDRAETDALRARGKTDEEIMNLGRFVDADFAAMQASIDAERAKLPFQRVDKIVSDMRLREKPVPEIDAALEAFRTADLRLGEIDQQQRNAASPSGIPDAPFRASWPALVMKRMIRWAVDNGYQKIAWTTGEQQAERYSLSQAVGGLEAEKRADGLYLVQADNTQAIDTVVSNGMAERDPESFHKAVMTADQMKQAFGANIADQLAAGADANRAAFAEGDTLSADLLMAELEDKPAAEIEAMRARLAELNREGPTSRRFRLEGEENLRVGGEGMKAFYDRNLVNITNDLIKKHGARVGPVNIAIGNRLNEDPRGATPEIVAAELALDAARRGGRAGTAEMAEVNRLRREWKSTTSVGAQPGFEITPQLAEVASKGFPLFQRTGQARGQIALAPDITSQPSIITLLRGADLSTFLHESGHFYWEVMTDLAGRPGASAEVRQDVQRMLDFVGVPDLPTWLGMTTADKREHHETIARSFEAYLFENKAPSPELRGLFGRFAQWLRAVYKELTGLNVELTDEVRGVFDRLLASDQEIAEAQMAQGLEPLLVERPEGVLDSEWAGYQREGLEATEEAVRELASRSLRDMQYAGRAAARELKRLRRESAENRKAVKEEVDAELRAEPVYRAIRYLRTGQLDDQPKIDGESYKLHTGLVREILKLDTSPARVFFRGVPEGVSGSAFRVAERGPMGRGVYLSGVESVARQYGSNVVKAGVVGNVLDGVRGRVTPELESGVRSQMTEEEIARFDRWKTPQGVGDFVDQVSRSVEADRIPQIFSALGYVGIEANVDGHEIVVFDPKNIIDPNTPLPMPASLNGMTSTDNGANPQQLADLFGYSSANQLLHDLLFASPIADAIEAETDNRMRERFGELSSPEALESAVQSAIHNAVRGRFVATELAMLQKAPGKRRALTAAASKLARDTIERLKLRSVRPGQYEAGERRAARLAAETRGNLAEAAAHKRNQLLQFHLAKEAHAAREEADNIRRYLTKFGNANTRKAIDKSFLDQIDTLLEAVQLKPISDLEAQRRTEMSKWIESMRDEGFEPAFDADFLAQINKRAWRDLTVDEIRQLQEAVKNIEWLGRRTKELLTAKDKADLDQAANEVADSIRTFATRSFEEGVGSPNWWDKVKSGARDFLAQHRKFANMVYVIDGNKYGGAAWERFTRGMNEAGDRETTLNADATRRLAAIFKPLDGMDLHSKHFEPEIGKSVSLETRLMTALNWGNATNRARVMDGDGWTQEQVEKLLEPLTDEHWTFVENVWDFIDSYWPEISAKQERVTGVLPEKVVAEPFQFTPKDGAMRLLRGGYFPIKFDPDRSSKAEADTAAEVLTQMKRGLYTNATTRRGHIKERVDTVRGRPIRKDFGVIFGHTTQVIHDLAWHETLIDTNRLLRHGAIDAALREHYGPEVLRWMRKALEDIATGDIPAQNAFERSVNYVRAGASISAMGWSIWTSLLQPVGLTQSIVRIGVKHVARGIGDLFGSPKAMNDKIEWVYSASPFMQERARTMQREVNEIRNKISPKSPLRRSIERVVPAPAADFVADSWFYMLGKAQLVADLPTWLGQYEKSMDAGESPDRAVAIADQAVIDSQSSGLIKDLAGIQRGGPVLKLWTSFYSYFSATYNLLVDRTHELKRKGAGDLPYFAADVAMLTFVPATITSVMYGVLKGGDDDEPEDWLKRIAADNLNYMLGTMIGVREVGGALTGFAGYSGPAGARVFSAVGNLGKQVAQGEIDEAALRSANAVGGVLLHYPSAQIDKTVRGLIQYANGDAGPQAVLVGPPPKK